MPGLNEPQSAWAVQQRPKSYDKHMLAVRFVLATAILLGSGQPAVKLKDDFDTDRARMVDQQIAARGIRNRLVLR